MDFFNFTTKVSIRFGTNSRQVDLVPEHASWALILRHFPLPRGVQILKKELARGPCGPDKRQRSFVVAILLVDYFTLSR